MRLNAFIAHNSARSRREADSLIEQGRVRINRQKAQLGASITEGDKVFIDGNLLKPRDKEQYTFIIYHKPKGELVAKADSRGRKTIYDSLETRFKGFVPVGRLDFASEGVLILGDSKPIVSALMHSQLEREYIIKIHSKITKQMCEAMENGLTLSDASRGAHALSSIASMEFAPFCSYQVLKDTPTFSRLKVVIQEGQNRELRRFFGYFKAEVLDLRRVRYGFASLNALPVGKWRYFSKDEYKQLRRFLHAKPLIPKSSSRF